jgi:hypothetical protein
MQLLGNLSTNFANAILIQKRIEMVVYFFDESEHIFLLFSEGTRERTSAWSKRYVGSTR